MTTLSYDRATQVFSAYYTLDQTTVPGQMLVRTSFTNTTPRRVAWYNFNGTVPLNPTRWLHLGLGYWYAYRVYQVTINGGEVNTRTPAFGGEVTATATLPQQWVLEVAADALSGEAAQPPGRFGSFWPTQNLRPLPLPRALRLTRAPSVQRQLRHQPPATGAAHLQLRQRPHQPPQHRRAGKHQPFVG